MSNITVLFINDLIAFRVIFLDELMKLYMFLAVEIFVVKQSLNANIYLCVYFKFLIYVY